MSGKAIVFINGELTKHSVFSSLKAQGFYLINFITSNQAQTTQKEHSYDDIMIIQGSIPEALERLKLLFQTKQYSLREVLAIQQNDVELADTIREFFGNPFNGESFRALNQNKKLAITRLNQDLQVKPNTKDLTLEEFSQEIFQQSLPCTIKVVNSQQTLATYLIAQYSDINSILKKLRAYQASDIKLWIQPYYENLYCLQIATARDEALAVALWHEKSSVEEGEIQKSIQMLMDPKDSEIISPENLKILSRQLVKTLGLSHGIGEFVLALDRNQIIVMDYNLGVPNFNQIEVMERVAGYSPLSCYLLQSAAASEIALPKKAFKNVAIMYLPSKSKNELLTLSTLPTYYKYHTEKPSNEDRPLRGVLYLVHKNKNLVVASYSSIQNMEQLLLNAQFSSHSATHIVDFYREAAISKKTDYTLGEDDEQSLEEGDALKQLTHERQHIPRYVKPLDSKASIQDVMRYYIDIYDLYILHGKPPGTKMTPMNTGNPAFLPFPPIVDALRKSLQENLLPYARYSMQVPEVAFVDKIAQYCQVEKLFSSAKKLETKNVVIGHGSTNLYYLALKSVIKNKGDIVLITRPTYGLFIDPVYTAGGDVGFLDIQESSGWKVQPQNLQETIHFYNQKAFNNYILNTFLKEYKKFLHAQKIFGLEETSIPPMPKIEGLIDLRVFDNYIIQLNAYIDSISDPLVNKDELKFSFSPRVRAFYHMNPHNPTGAVYTKDDLTAIAEVLQTYPDIYIIDDLAHWGVLYSKVEPATFSSLDNMFEKTLTLMSLSKSYCVPGLRTGVAIGSAEIISEMQYRLLNSSSSATLPAMIALDAVFSAPKEERDRYLQSNSQEYFYRRNLMGSLINGIQKMDVAFAEKIKIYQAILENEYKKGKPFDKKLLNLMLLGMPLVRTLTDPQGCFFHLLDISRLIGAKVGGSLLQTSTDVRNAIYSICKIDTVPGEISGNFFNYSLRMSFSLSPQQIYNACKSINLFIGSYIIKQNPSILTQEHSINVVPLALPEIEVIDEDILNKALTKLYLNKVIEAITAKHTELFTLNYLQNKPRLQELAQRMVDLNALAEKVLNPSLTKIVHQEIHDYIRENNHWLKGCLPDIELLIAANDSALSLSKSKSVSQLTMAS